MNRFDDSFTIPEPKFSRMLFGDSRFAWIWAVLRVYVGYEWLVAGWAKIKSPAWAGAQAGTAIQGFLNGALQKTAGPHPDVSGWYATFLSNVVIPHSVLFSYLVTYGELIVGACLILGAFVGIAAFFGAFMNLNYLFAGTISINPLLLLAQLFLILAWRNAGWAGLDAFLLPKLGVPWQTEASPEAKTEISPMQILVLVMGIGFLVIIGISLLFQ